MPLFAVTYDDDSTVVLYGTKPFSAPKPVGLEPRIVSEIATSSEVFIPFFGAVTAAGDVTARVLTVSIGTLTGFPVPTLTVSAATVDSVSVLPDVTTSGVGIGFTAEYTFEDSEEDLPYSFTVTATNIAGTDTSVVSGTLPSNLPTSISTVTLTGGVATLTLDFAVVGGVPNVTSFEYEIALSTDTAFVSPVYSGAVVAYAAIEFTPVAAESYIARVRSLRDGKASPWVAETTPAVVTAP